MLPHTLLHLILAVFQCLFTDFTLFDFCIGITFTAFYLHDWVGSVTNEEALNEKDKKKKTKILKFKKMSPV